ncbi:HARB1-like protein [Mya arenaria]|uniref:HARB1-like protein n=1 Tax=Mya arenaria TaxID=6604 RepID=A0ABY7EI10_MYAAR|nr:HARB1-like protein [Mya arenaria]
MDQVAEGFSARCGVPGIVGAVDGTHVPVPGPRSQHRASFINRKGYPSIQMQVVCDSKLRLLDTYTRWPGSVHDGRVFRNSPLQDVCQQLPAPNHLIGDSAYPLSREGDDVVEDVECDSSSVEEEGCSDSLNAAGKEKRRNIANMFSTNSIENT